VVVPRGHFNRRMIYFPMKYKLDFTTQYRQFYIGDKGYSQDTGDEGFWTIEAMDAHLAIGNGILGVGIGSYGHVKAEVFILTSKRNNVDYSSYDHVVEGWIDIQSGVLQFLDCPNSHVEFELQVAPSRYGVRVYSLNLGSVIGDYGDDSYEIEIWPDVHAELIILKQYQEE
jgi:hypothetical protein